MSGAILLAITSWDPNGWDRRFRSIAPGRDVRLWPDRIGDAGGIDYACAWKPPRGLLAGYPDLKAIFSLGAGVDHLLTDPSLPDVPVVRIVDQDLTMPHERIRRAARADASPRASGSTTSSSATGCGATITSTPRAEVTVGVMGLGVMGRDAIEVLARLGFRLVGWSRTQTDDSRRRDVLRSRRPRSLPRPHRDSRLPAAAYAGDRTHPRSRGIPPAQARRRARRRLS